MTTDVGFRCDMFVNGTQQVLHNLTKFAVAANIGFQSGMQEVVDKIYDDSQFLVPVDKGPLRASGDKLVVVMLGANMQSLTVVGEVTYGKGLDYAVYVHEDPSKHHDPPTQAKFLEDPVKQGISSGDLLRRFQSKLLETLLRNYTVMP